VGLVTRPDVGVEVVTTLPTLPVWSLLALGGFVVASILFMFWARRWMGRQVSGKGRLDEGRLIGVVGLPGFGKTSFIMSNYVVPALQSGRTVIANFSVYADDLPGRFVKLKPSNFGLDLLGIGSSLNLDDDGLPVSGWFIDTACTCGKTGREQLMCPCNGLVLVIDEGHAFLPANQSKGLPVDVLTWLTMCRKNHLMIIWATQYYKWIHSAVRRLTQEVFMCQRELLGGHHVARSFGLDPIKGDLGNVCAYEVKYDVRTIGHLYDTSEVVVAAHTAYELAGELSRKHLRRGGGARYEHAADHAPVIPGELATVYPFAHPA